MIEIYTDGSCLGNPGPGGWAVLIMNGDKKEVLSGGEDKTTNNRMEMTAVINALRSFGEQQELTLFTDSQYVQRGMVEWLPQWQKNNWRTAGKKAVKNRDLWEELLKESKRHKVRWCWVRSHDDNPHNEEVDKLARAAINPNSDKDDPRSSMI